MPTIELTSRLLFLCSPDRRNQYLPTLGEHGRRITWIDRPEEIVTWSIRRPPAAVLIDVPTAIRADPETMRRVYEMQIAAPIMRTNIRTGGTIGVFSAQTGWHGTLDGALEAIGTESLPITQGIRRRRLLRVDFQSRVLIHVPGEESPRRANTLDISGEGCFVISYDPLPIGHPAELEFIDADYPAPRSKGVVAWKREWDPAGLIPGMGFRLDAVTVSPIIEMVVSNLSLDTWPPRSVPPGANAPNSVRSQR